MTNPDLNPATNPDTNPATNPSGPQPDPPPAQAAILACVDGSLYTDSVCDHAGWASRRLAAPVRLLHVQAPHDEAGVPTDLSGAIGLGERSALLEKLAQVDASRAKLDQQKGKLILEHAEARLMAAGVGQIDALHRRGSLVETIAEFEGATQLIVIGKRGEAADLARLHLGSNLERVVRAAHRPVLVAARAFQPIRRFMLAYDGGASTRKAVAYVASSPLFRGLTCHLLKVGADNGANRADLAAAATTLQQAGLDVQPQLQAGHADDVIAAAVQTEQTDLLVMGAYGHSHMRTLIIGSTTSTMLRSCPIPVLLFR